MGPWADFMSDLHAVHAPLLIAALVRFMQVCITFGTKVPAGLFVPSLFVGACIGRSIGEICAWIRLHYGVFPLHPEPGLYAMVGWAAKKRFEISKSKFILPRVRTYEMIGLVLGCIEINFCK